MYSDPRQRAWFVTVAILTLTGCVGQNSMSSYARSGDTVVVAFGAANDPPQYPVYRAEDLVAELIDSQNITRAVRIRSVINIYPDPTSPSAAEQGSLNQLGLRTAVIDLVDSAGNPYSYIAPGTAKLVIKRTNGTVVAGAAPAGNAINIKILEGTGGPLHPFTENALGQNYMAALVARPQVRYRIQVVGSYQQTLAAAEVEFRYPYSSLAGRAEKSWPQAVYTRADSNMEFSTRYYQEGADQVIKVLMVNPDGIKKTTTSPAEVYRGLSLYSAMHFAIVWGDSDLLSSYPPDTFSASTITGAHKFLRVFDVAGTDVSVNFNLVVE